MPGLVLLACVALLGCETQRLPSAADHPSKAPATQSLPVLTRPTASSPAPVASAPDASAPLPSAVTSSAVTSSAAPPGMQLVPGGSFTMGADAGGEEDEHPAHTVTVDAFYLDLTEVTQEAYIACVDESVCAAPKIAYLESFGGAFRGPQRPVVGVSQADAIMYCTHVGKRLPREAEFERAVRGDDARTYPWGNQKPTRELAVFGGSVTADVGSRPLGRGPYGHHDLAGNVWEWLADPYDPYAYKRSGAARGEVGTCAEIIEFQNELRRAHKQGYTGTNPIPTACEASIRGGAYNMGANALRASNRVHHPGNFRLQMTGFRCAKDAPEQKPSAPR